MVNGKISQRTRHFDPRVIDHAIQCARAQIVADLVSCKLHGRFVRHVKQQWNEVFSEFFLQAVGVFSPANAAEHAESAIEEHLRRGMTNSSRDSGDNDLLHGSSGRYSMVTEEPTRAIFNFGFWVAVHDRLLTSTSGSKRFDFWSGRASATNWQGHSCFWPVSRQTGRLTGRCRNEDR